MPELGITQFRQAPPGTDQRVLNRILRLVRVTEHDPRKGVEPSSLGGSKNLERRVVAASCRFHEIALHAHSRPIPGRSGPLDST